MALTPLVQEMKVFNRSFDLFCRTLFIVVPLALFALTPVFGQTTYFSRASGNWNESSTWSTVGFGSSTNAGTFPIAGDQVNIGGGFTVTVTAAAACASLSYDAGTGTINEVSLQNTNSLTVSGAVTIPRNGSGNSNRLAVGDGTLSVGSVSFTTGAGAGTQQLTLGNGTATISGNISGYSGAGTLISFSGAGLLGVGGSMFPAGSGLIQAGTGTVAYNGAGNQTVSAQNYHHLLFTGGGSKVLGTGAVTTIAASGSLVIDGGTQGTIPGVTFINNGSTLVDGSLVFSSGLGTKTFVGPIVVNGLWNNAANESVAIRGGITNNGTFNAGNGRYTFGINNQALTGNLSIPVVTITGITVSNEGQLTISNDLAGNGTLSQGVGALLQLGGSLSISAIQASASNNTVNYVGNGQTVYGINYVNLGLSGTGLKTLQVGTTEISGNFSIGGTTSASAVTGMTFGGDVTLGAGTTFTAGSFTHSVAGDFIDNGSTFDVTGSTFVLDGAAQAIGGSAGTVTFHHLTLDGSGVKLFDTEVAVEGTLSILTGVQADLGTILSHTASGLQLGGSPVGGGTWGSSISAADNTNDTFFALSTGLLTVDVGSTRYYARANSNWNDPNTWSTVGFGGVAGSGFPTATDEAFIGGGFTVTVTADAACVLLQFEDIGGGSNQLSINSDVTLDVAGEIILPRNGGSNILSVGSGSLTTTGVQFTAGSGSGVHRLSLSTGTVTVSGSVSSNTSSANIQYTGNGLVQVSGAMFGAGSGTLTTTAGSRFEYNGGTQVVQVLTYRDLILSGTGTKTFSATTTIGGNLTLGGTATLAVGSLSLVVTGTTHIPSANILSINSAIGTKTFSGLVTIDGLWNNVVGESITFRGGITNNGTFNAGNGRQTFATNAQVLTGAFVIPNLAVSGINLTNTNDLTISNDAFGTGALVQGVGATLTINGTFSCGLNAMAADNTVTYSGNGQTVASGNYGRLVLSGTGIKTLQAGTTSIAEDFILSGSAQTTATAGLTIGGDFSMGAGNSFTAGSFTHVLAGNWTNTGGTFDGTGSTFQFDGGSLQTISGTPIFHHLIINNVSAQGVENASAQVLTGGFTNNGRFSAPALTVQGDIALATATITNVPVVTLSGPASQLFSGGGNTLSEVVVNKSSGSVSLTSSLLLSGVLNIETATSFASDGHLVLLSTADDPVVDARIGPVASGGNLTGQITVQRFMGAEGNVNRYISSPVIGANVGQLADDFTISPNSVRLYNETRLGGAHRDDYVEVGASHVMETGRGYLAYMLNGDGALDITWDVAGTVAVGNVVLPVTHSVSAPPQLNNDGWNLVGNPYASGIVWNNGSGWTRSASIGAVITVPDIGSPGNPDRTYNYFDQSGDLPNGVIAMGQAFWVYAGPGETPVLEVNEAAKNTSLSGSFYRTRTENIPRSAQIAVTLRSDAGADRAFLKFNPLASSNFDWHFDAFKRDRSDRSSVALMDVSGNWLHMHTLPSDMADVTVPLALQLTGPGNYVLEMDVSQLGDKSRPFYLIDRLKGESFELSGATLAYPFEHVGTEEAVTGRFVISTDAEVAQPGGGHSFQVYPNPAGAQLFVKSTLTPVWVEIRDLSGRLLQSGRLAEGQGMDVLNLAPGLYLVRVVTAEGSWAKQWMKQ